MIYGISNKGKTSVQCQLIGGEAIVIQPKSRQEVDSSKIFRREIDRLNRIPGVRVLESGAGTVKPKPPETKPQEEHSGDGKSGKKGGNK